MSSVETAVMDDTISYNSGSRQASRDGLESPSTPDVHPIAPWNETRSVKSQKGLLKTSVNYGALDRPLSAALDVTVDTNLVESIAEIDISDNEKGGISRTEALYHIICVMAGSGLLQIPFALRLSGWIGIPLILFSTFVTEYTGRLLVKCLYRNGVRIHGGYPEIGLNAYGETGRWCVLLFYNLVLVGVACLYVILSSLNLSLLVGVFSQTQWIVISSLVSVIPFIMFPSLKEVAIVSLFGSIASILVVFAVLVVGLYDIRTPSWKPEYDWVVPSSLASAMATFTFSFGGNFVYPEVERSMAKPEEFPRVLNQAMWIIMGLYLLIGAVGYGCYGRDVQSPILFNMSPGIITTTSILLVTLHVLLACPILLTTFSLGIERNWKPLGQEDDDEATVPLLSGSSRSADSCCSPSSDHGLIYNDDVVPMPTPEPSPIPPHQPLAMPTHPAIYDSFESLGETPKSSQPLGNSWQDVLRVKTFRILISIMMCLIAVSVPYFSDLMGLLGAVANTMLIFIFPVVFYMKLYPENCQSFMERILLYGILGIGLVAGSVGGYEAFVSLISHYQSNV